MENGGDTSYPIIVMEHNTSNDASITLLSAMDKSMSSIGEDSNLTEMKYDASESVKNHVDIMCSQHNIDSYTFHHSIQQQPVTSQSYRIPLPSNELILSCDDRTQQYRTNTNNILNEEIAVINIDLPMGLTSSPMRPTCSSTPAAGPVSFENLDVFTTTQPTVTSSSKTVTT